MQELEEPQCGLCSDINFHEKNAGPMANEQLNREQEGKYRAAD